MIFRFSIRLTVLSLEGRPFGLNNTGVGPGGGDEQAGDHKGLHVE